NVAFRFNPPRAIRATGNHRRKNGSCTCWRKQMQTKRSELAMSRSQDGGRPRRVTDFGMDAKPESKDGAREKEATTQLQLQLVVLQKPNQDPGPTNKATWSVPPDPSCGPGFRHALTGCSLGLWTDPLKSSSGGAVKEIPSFCDQTPDCSDTSSGDEPSSA